MMSSFRLRLALAVAVAVALVAAPVVGWAGPPTWSDTPALVAAATAPQLAALRRCVAGGARRELIYVVTRRRDGASQVGLPMAAVGHRGFTAEELCLGGAIGRVALPPLPDEVERALLGVALGSGGVVDAAEPGLADWRDLPAALGRELDVERRAALARCAPRARTVRLVLDLRAGATRVWLPAWQFHAPSGDGTTPPAEARVRGCLTRAIAGWRPSRLPRALGELELAIAVVPPPSGE